MLQGTKNPLPGHRRTPSAKHVLIVDDHALIHTVVGGLIRKAFGPARIREAKTVEAAIDSAGRGHPLDLVVMDLGLPGCQGVDAVTRFRASNSEIPLVVLSAVTDAVVIIAALKAGAAGYIPKAGTPKVTIAALRLVAAGGTYVPLEALFDPDISASSVETRPAADLALTARQRDVLNLLLKGYSNQRIASELAIAESTVKHHAHAVYNALGVSTRAELISGLHRTI